MAADRTWTDTAINNLWGTTTNWLGNLPPSSTDNAVFTDPPGGGTVDLGATTRTINTLHFSNTTGSYTVTDGTLALSQITQDADVFSNTIDATAAINASTLTMDVEGGELNVAGKITATNLVLPYSTANAQQVQLSNTSNSISSVSIQGGPALNAFSPGSIGAASVQLSGGGILGLYTDITNANYNNAVSVSGSGGLVADLADANGPTSDVVNLGALSMQASANLSFETHDNYSIAVASTSISGAATFTGTQTFLGEGPSQLQLGAVTGTAGSSITLIGVGKLVLNQASSYGGGTFVDSGGMLVLGANGAAGSAAVNVYSGGAVDITTALSSLPTLNVGYGGATDAALAGNLTGAVYSGGSENVFLASGSIIAATAGAVPVRGVDVSSAAYYLGITSDTQSATVGDNAAHTSIYMGAAFGLYTPIAAAFSGTISAAQTGQNIPIYIAPGSQEFSGEKFNTTDTTTGVDFSGPGEVVFANTPGGTATLYTDTGTGVSSQDSFLVMLGTANILTSGKTFNVSNGILYPSAKNSVASGGIVNINSGATLYLDPGAMTNGPSTGTYNINAGGAVYLLSSTASPGHGATFTFAANSLILIGGSLSTGSPTFLPTTSDIILDTPGTLSVTGAGIVLGNGHRLTTSPATSVTLSGGTGITAPSASTITITASDAASTLQINDPLSLAGTDLQIGDSNSFTTVNFTQRVSDTQNGTVILDNDSDTVKDLNLAAGTLIVGQTSADHFSTGNYTQNGGVATFHGKLTLSGALTVSSGVTHLSANYGASGADSAASLSIASGATLDIGDNTLNVAAATASAIRSEILAAYDHGNWDQPGLTSSFAGTATHDATGIGYTTSGSSASIRFTWLGDTNLDGVVNAADLSAISPTGTTWAAGDFNYDGVVNADDYALFMLGSAYGGTNITSVVPEPGIFALACGGFTLLSARRRLSRNAAIL